MTTPLKTDIAQVYAEPIPFNRELLVQALVLASHTRSGRQLMTRACAEQAVTASLLADQPQANVASFKPAQVAA